MGVRLEKFENKTLSVILEDDRLGHLARITYPAFADNTSYTICPYAETDNRCDVDTMAFVPANTTITTNNGSVLQNNQTLFAVSDIFALPNLRFDFINQTGASLQFSVAKDGVLLGIIALRWKSRIPDINGSKT